jgi:hypothetical protein
LQRRRDPVGTGPGELTAQSVVRSSVPGSGVPAAAPCHSRFVTSRLPESRHAWFAWNQVMQPVGGTPGMDTAYTPGEGGLDPATGVQFPYGGKFAGKPGLHGTAGAGGAGLTCVAPALMRSTSLALPSCTLLMSVLFVSGICHTLAS